MEVQEIIASEYMEAAFRDKHQSPDVKIEML